MRKQDFLPEMKTALERGDGKLATSLDDALSHFEEGRDSFQFIAASKTAREWGCDLEKCIVIHGLPRGTTVERAREFAEYLLREARRKRATYVDFEEGEDGKSIEYEYVVARFPGRRQEDNYDARAFVESIVAIAKNPQASIEADESQPVDNAD